MSSDATASGSTARATLGEWVSRAKQSAMLARGVRIGRIGLDVGVWVWVAIVAACVHLLVFTALVEWDSHIFLMLGKWLPQGIIPYRDALEVKPPAIFFYLGGLFALFPDAMWVVRFADVGWTLIGAWALVRLLKPSTGRFIAAMGATTWMYWQHESWFTSAASTPSSTAPSPVSRRWHASIRSSAACGSLPRFSSSTRARR